MIIVLLYPIVLHHNLPSPLHFACIETSLITVEGRRTNFIVSLPNSSEEVKKCEILGYGFVLPSSARKSVATTM
jgi:hypothetical protein